MVPTAETARRSSRRTTRIFDDLSTTLKKHGGTDEDLRRAHERATPKSDDLTLMMGRLWQDWPKVNDSGELID